MPANDEPGDDVRRTESKHQRRQAPDQAGDSRHLRSMHGTDHRPAAPPPQVDRTHTIPPSLRPSHIDPFPNPDPTNRTLEDSPTSPSASWRPDDAAWVLDGPFAAIRALDQAPARASSRSITGQPAQRPALVPGVTGLRDDSTGHVGPGARGRRPHGRRPPKSSPYRGMTCV